MSPKVMVIGDDEISTRELASLLEEAGIKIMILRNDDELNKIPEVIPDAIVIEEKAGNNGWEISSHIRQHSDIPIILLGTSDSEIAWVKAAAYGVDCYLAKPFSSGELAARIKTLIRRHEGTPEGFSDSETRNIAA